MTASCATQADVPEPPASFVHEAGLYEGDAGFLALTVPFIVDGVTAGEVVRVAVSAEKRSGLRRELGSAAAAVSFVDMQDLGANPARIIPAWQRFVDEHAGGGRHLRGVGEPVWPGRSPAELDECHRHEVLLNLAFAGNGRWRLLCPYDTASLEPSVIQGVWRAHPAVRQDGQVVRSDRYRRGQAALAPFEQPLPQPAATVVDLAFERAGLAALRRLVTHQAAAAGLGSERTADLLVAVNEAATNSLNHGGGRGRLRLWHEDDGTLVCEVADQGRLSDPLAGREHPRTDLDGGRGLWLVNHLCDLVQVRSSSQGTVVRLSMRPAPARGGRRA